MDALFEKRNTQWAVLMFLAARGGKGMIQTATFARALRTTATMVHSELKQLELAGKIVQVKGASTMWEIVDFEQRFPMRAPTQAPTETTPAKVVLLTPDYWQQAAAVAQRIVRLYHSAIKAGGPFGPAISAVEARMKDGWTEPQLKAAIDAYRNHLGSDKTYARNAFNFFKLEDGVWFGQQFDAPAAQPKPAAPDSIAELAAKMGAR